MEEDILQQSDSALIAIGGDAVAGTLNLCEVELIKDDIDITATTTYADLELAKATYTGHGQEVVTWGDATRSDDGEIEYLGDCGEFRPTGTTITNGIYGLYVRNAGHTDTLFQCRFASPPIPMESALDAIKVTLRYRPGSNSLAVLIS